MSVEGRGLAARTLLTAESGPPGPGSSERERRGRKSRRSSDHRQAMLSELALWFANRDVRAVVIVDEKCNIVLLNDVARSMIESGKGISILDGKLGFDHERQRDEFDRWWSDGADEAPVTLRSPRPAGAISISRIPLGNAVQRLALLTIAGSVPPSIEQVRQQFGLTNAEAEIALGIFRGMSLVQIARTRKASINTVKTQARYVFQKCRVHSQSALTRRIGELVQKSG